MSKIWTPNHIDILLHYYACAIEHPRRGAPAVEEAINHFVSEGILEKNDHKIKGDRREFITTEKGDFFVEMILSTPLPKTRKEFYDPRFEKENL